MCDYFDTTYLQNFCVNLFPAQTATTSSVSYLYLITYGHNGFAKLTYTFNAKP